MTNLVIGHVNGNITEFEGAKVVDYEIIGYHPEEGTVKEFEIEFEGTGNRTTRIGTWYDEVEIDER